MASNTPPKTSNLDKLSQAKKFKEDGNEFHKKQNYKNAIGKYHRALLQLKGIKSCLEPNGILGAFMSEQDQQSMGYSEQVSEETKDEMTKLSADCYNNLSACLLKQAEPKYDKILEYCDKVLEVDPQNVKAYYRRGVAFYNQQKYDDALESFETAESIDSSFSASLLAKHKTMCKEGIRRGDQKLKNAYHGMFDKLAVNGANG